MGWLELLPLLKRLLPLLSRVAPMLETYVAARGAVREDVHTAFERFSGELKGDFVIAAQNHAELKQTLADQSSQIATLAEDVRHLRASNTEYATRLEAAEKQVASMSSFLKTISVFTILLLLVCVGLLTMLLLRH